MHEPLTSRVAAVAALDEPTRRRVYEYVTRRPGNDVGRDEIAEALGIPRATAAFHLEKLLGEGLLDVSYQRRNGRSGPGAGRPAKLYRRSARQVAVSLPERRYDLAGHLLAAALEESGRTGEPARTALADVARQRGKQIGETARDLLSTLEAHGFEPRVDGDEVVLGNCPFHTLAAQHQQLICGMNLDLLDGILTGIGNTGLTAHLDPQPGSCCVRLSGSGERSGCWPSTTTGRCTSHANGSVNSCTGTPTGVSASQGTTASMPNCRDSRSSS